MKNNLEISQEDSMSYYPSVNALRDAHLRLHKRSTSESQAPNFHDDVEDFLKMGVETGSFLDERNDRNMAQTLINYWATFLDRVGRVVQEVILKDFNPMLFPEIKDEDCPYLGLDSFKEEQKGFFFGRQSRINEMLRLLSEKQLLAVVGPSGSGKSSIVLAGLVPFLKSGRLNGSEKWHYFTPMVPGSNPLKSLTDTLEDKPKQQIKQPKNLSNHLDKLVKNLGEDSVIVIDQFEEVFTLCQNDTVRKEFIRQLQNILKHPKYHHTIILTMRSDFEEYLPRLSDFYNIFESSKYDLRPMSAAELREAIEEPAKVVGLKFEEGVVDSLLRDLLGEPAGLPLLQFTLLKLWNNRQRNRVTMEAYQKLGGGRLALERSAEEFYTQLLPEDQKRAQYIFLRMVHPGKGLEVMSNRVLQKTLYPTPGERKNIDQVLQKIIDARLIRLSKGDSPNDIQLEVAHEALVRNWGRLVDWIENERGRLRRRMRLTSAAEQWESVGRDRGALLRGVLLEEVLQYDDFNSLENEYIQASKIEVEKEQNRWQKLAEQAERQALLATARQLAAQSQITQFTHRSLLLALEALQTTLRKDEVVVSAAVEALQRALANSIGRGLGKYHTDSVTVALMMPDNRRLITSGSDKTIRIWDLTDPIPGETSKVLRGHDDAVNAITLSPSGRWLISGSADKIVRAWDMNDSGTSTFVLKQFWHSIRKVAISPDNRWLAVGTEDKVMYRWDMDDLGNAPIEMHGHIWGIRDIAFSHDSQWMLSGSDDGTVRLWNLQNKDNGMALLGGSDDAIWAVSITSDNQWLIACSVRGIVRVWKFNQLDIPPVTIQTSHGSITTMAVTSNSQWLITGGADSMVRLWNLADLTAAPIILAEHEDWINVVVVSGDNRWLITGSGDKTVRVWDLKNLFTSQLQAIVVRGHERAIRSASISKDSRLLATCSDDGTVQLIDLEEVQKTPYPQVIDNSRAPIAISHDNRWLATSSKDNTIMLIDLARPTDNQRTLNWKGMHIRTLAISPDSHWLIVGSEYPQLLVCDLTDPDQQCFELHGHAWGIHSVAISSDSQWLASGSDDHTIRLWNSIDMGAGSQVLTGGDSPVTKVVISPDRKWLISGDWYGIVRIWDLTNLSTASHVLCRHQSPIWALQVSPDSRWLVTTSRKDPYAYVYDLREPTAPPKVLAGHGKWVTSVKIGVDSRHIITVSEDSLIRVWDLANLSAPPMILRGHEWAIRAMDISSDNSLLITGSDDKSTRIWQMNDLLEEPIVLRGHTSPITELAITPNNSWLVTGSVYENTHVWTLQLRDMMDQASHLAGRNFFLDEWKQYFPRQNYRKTCPSFRVPHDVIQHELEQAHLFLKQQDLSGSGDAYRRAAVWSVETDDPDLNHEVGRQGCFDGFAKIVLPACERAIALNPANEDYRDTRGIARMLTGDLNGAIEDFQFYLSEASGKQPKEKIVVRKAWLEQLKQGNIPIESSIISK